MVCFKVEKIMSWDSTERRQFVRAKLPCQINVPGAQQRIISTRAQNISAGGIRVFINEKLYASSIVDLEIYGISNQPISCTGKVIWTFTRKTHHSKQAPLYDTGIEFHQIKEADVKAIKKLVASIASRLKK
jgi:c-di-GMP-binding flagellar brake protein YcgR